MLQTLGRCGPDKWVLVLGAGRGVGVAALQIARLSGAQTIAVSTSPEKLKKAKTLGAVGAILAPPEDILQATRRLTGGRMVDIAFEHIGPVVFEAALKSLRPGGKLVTCGATTGPMVPVDLRYVFSRQLQILGSKMGTRQEMFQVARLMAEGRLRPIVDRVFPLSEARKAHEYLAEKRQFGKVVLKP
jgi:NADPH:quinone reductase-like Zn-dependent oxidoreductase